MSATRQFELSTLGEELAVADASEAELLGAMDWLLPQQERVEAALARRYLRPGGFVLYDLSASYLEGRACPLAALGYPRDGRRGKLQIQYGLTCSPEGRPVAVEVFDGKIHDHKTLPSALERIKQRFGIERVVVCATAARSARPHRAAQGARLRLDHGAAGATAAGAGRGRRPAAVAVRRGEPGRDHLRALPGRAPSRLPQPARRPRAGAQARGAARRHRAGASEGAGLGREPARAPARRARRADRQARRPGRQPLQGRKHFQLTIADGRFAYVRNEQTISEEAARDGFYVLRTSVAADALTPQAVVRAYKLLARAERAFRAMKSPELEVRPLHHRLEDRVRAHVFVCMLAYAVRFELELRLVPLLFKDDSPLTPADPVAAAQRSPAAKRKAGTKQTEDGPPVSSKARSAARSCKRRKRRARRQAVEAAGSSATGQRHHRRLQLGAEGGAGKHRPAASRSFRAGSADSAAGACNARSG